MRAKNNNSFIIQIILTRAQLQAKTLIVIHFPCHHFLRYSCRFHQEYFLKPR